MDVHLNECSAPAMFLTCSPVDKTLHLTHDFSP
jgi:hypothetical protein